MPRALVVGLCGLCVALAAPRAAQAKHAPARAPRVEKRPSPSVARLGRGYRRFAAGDYAGARSELGPLAASKLRSVDLALYLLAESESLDGALGPARDHFRRVAGMSASRFATVAVARAADAAFEMERFPEARAGYEKALASPSPLVEPAVLRFRLAEIAARAPSSKKAAAAGFRRVYVEHPEHPLAERALARLTALDPAAAIAPHERVERARRLTAGRKWQEALDELEKVPASAPAEVRTEADYGIGENHFKMRRGYDLAAAKLTEVAERFSGDRRTEALFRGARAYSRSELPDGDDRAIAGYRNLVSRYPGCRQAAEASFLCGWLEYNRGRWKEAIPGLEETIRRYGESTFAVEARWYLGFSRWLSGDLAGALADFERLARRPGALDGGKGSYWRGMALAKLDRSSDAVAVWRKLATDHPFSWYATLARLRLEEREVKLGPFGDATSHAVTPLGVADAKLASEPALARADELLEAGLKGEAALALDEGDGPLLEKLGPARALPALLERDVKAEGFHRAMRLAEAHSGGALRQDPYLQASARAWWEHVYPLAWREFVEKYGPSGDSPPYYLYTIMQKESAYNPHDVSYADAIGLLQMIPPTSRRVAKRIGRPYTDDVLYDPEGNIQFGAWYIGHLLAKFKGQIPLGAGSYNAGPKAMMKWVKKNGARPLDEFVELVAYPQTREYIKKAAEIYSRYVWLYAHEDWRPSMTVDAEFLDNDLDY